MKLLTDVVMDNVPTDLTVAGHHCKSQVSNNTSLSLIM